MFTSILRTAAWALALGAAMRCFGQEHLQCNDAYAWSPSTTGTIPGIASAPVNDTAFNPAGNSYSYFSQGTHVFAVRNVADGPNAAGTIKWDWQTSPSVPSLITGSPVPALLSPVAAPAREAVFVAAEDGFLYKVNADDKTTGNLSTDTRRYLGGQLACATSPGDRITATPAVQLYNFANPAFKSAIDSVPGHGGDDLVFVITHNGCGDTTHNRIIAYWASDLTPKWTFNADGAVKVDAGYAGCTIDYASNRLFCGTDLQDGSTGQGSLFALDSTTGQLIWSTNAGSILNRPRLHNGRLYVANKPGAVQAYDPNGNGAGLAAPLWTSPLAVASPGSIIARDPWPVGNALLVVDSLGTLHRIQDNGTTGTLSWDANAIPGVQFRSAPVAVGSLNKAYIGRDDGRIQEIDLPSGTLGWVVDVDPPSSDVFDPFLDVEGASDPNRLVVVGGAKVTRLKIPFCEPRILGRRADFNGDDRSDVFWRDTSGGLVYQWQMNGLALSGQGYMPAVPTTWSVAGIGDTNSDGRADVLWRNAGSGLNYLWLMNGLAISSQGYLPTVADPWMVVGLGDANGDRHADVFWRNPATGQNYLWIMSGLTVAFQGYLPTVAGPDWEVAGVADHSGDGKADVLWRNKATGANYLWVMNGLIVSSQGYLPTVTPADWEVVGSPDANGDGKADVLWRHKTTGQNYLWVMNGLAVTSQGNLPTVADTNWKVVGDGDYNGNGRGDVLWRNAGTGQDYLWILNGLSVASQGYLPSVSGANWQPVKR